MHVNPALFGVQFSFQVRGGHNFLRTQRFDSHFKWIVLWPIACILIDPIALVHISVRLSFVCLQALRHPSAASRTTISTEGDTHNPPTPLNVILLAVRNINEKYNINIQKYKCPPIHVSGHQACMFAFYNATIRMSRTK